LVQVLKFWRVGVLGVAVAACGQSPVECCAHWPPPAYALVYGVVSTGSGAPLPSARVQMYINDLPAVLTNEMGQYRLPVKSFVASEVTMLAYVIAVLGEGATAHPDSVRVLADVRFRSKPEVRDSTRVDITLQR
jgi:hypothetical protein